MNISTTLEEEYIFINKYSFRRNVWEIFPSWATLDLLKIYYYGTI